MKTEPAVAAVAMAVAANNQQRAVKAVETARIASSGGFENV